MSEELKNQMQEIDNVEVEAVAETDLEDVAGGGCSSVLCSSAQD